MILVPMETAGPMPEEALLIIMLSVGATQDRLRGHRDAIMVLLVFLLPDWGKVN